VIEDPRVIEPLKKALKDRDDEVPWYAAEALGNMRDERAVDALIGALKDVRSRVRLKALEALIKIGEPAVEPLIKTLEKDEPTRVYAAEALGNMRDERAVDALIGALKDVRSRVRSKAAWALGEIGDMRAIIPLTTMLSDNIDEVRINAIDALIKIGSESVVAPLIDALNDIPVIREKAAKALGNIGDSAAVDPLANAWRREEDEKIRITMYEALEKL
jgi:HEAT repeat protein